jgi:photosystem II stability/assembly factor-like uncharacterized protein
LFFLYKFERAPGFCFEINCSIMKKIFFMLPAISILYFSCSKSTSSTQPPPVDTLPPPPPPPPPSPIDTLASGWEKIPLNSSSEVVSDIFFVNNTGFAIGSLGILKSSDGGNTWSHLITPSGVNNSLYNMGMGNEMNAIFVGSPSQVVSTRDGGTSFTISTLADNSIADVFFVDSITAYATGTNIWKTTDAGNNWTNLYSFTSTGYNPDYSSLYFLNPQTGWVFRKSGLYKTIDDGVDWASIPTQSDVSQSQAVFFLNSDTGYISSGQFIQRTMDGGASWTTIFTASGSAYRDIHFVSDETGYVTDNTHIYKTQDGGNTWTSEVHLVSNTLIELHFIDPNHGWACGTNGTILKYSR